MPRRIAFLAVLCLLLTLGTMLAARADKITDLCMAAGKGDLARVKTLVTAMPALVRSRDTGQTTALFHAVQAGKTNVATYLLDQGAEVNVVATDGLTPLHVAVIAGHAAVVELLLAHGAQIEAQDRRRMTPLHHAIYATQVITVAALLAHHADISATAGNGMMPLHLAALRGNPQIITLLLAQGAEIDALGAVGQAPLHLAVMSEKKAAVALLLAKGADPNVRNRENRTPLFYVRYSNEGYADDELLDAIAALLLKHGGKDPTAYLMPLYDQPICKGEMLLLPVDEIAEYFDITERTLKSGRELSMGAHKVVVRHNGAQVQIDGKPHTLPYPVQVQHDTTFIPVSLLTDAFNIKYVWDKQEQEFCLTDPRSEEQFVFALGNPLKNRTVTAEDRHGIHPIIDVGRKRLLGSVIDGRYTDDATTAAYLRSGEVYRFYAPDQYLGHGTGSPASDYRHAHSDLTTSPYSVDVDEAFGISGNWNALPRVPKTLDAKYKGYRDAVAAVLRQHKLSKAPIEIDQVLGIDLDGDGEQEQLISASALTSDVFSHAVFTENGFYSLLLLRKKIEGKYTTILLGGFFSSEYMNSKKSSVTAVVTYVLAAVLDVDGDGNQELIVRADSYNKDAIIIYRARGAGVDELLRWEAARDR